MKRIILSALLAAVGTAGAQDTIRYPDSCYMYNPFEIYEEGVAVIDRQAVFNYIDWFVASSIQPDSDYLASNGFELMQSPLSGAYYWIRHANNHPSLSHYKEYVASGQTWIYGIAATTGGNINGESVYINRGQYLDSIYTLAELLNVSQITDSNFNLYAYLYGVSNGEVYCIDSVKWIRHNNPYRYFEYQWYIPPEYDPLYPPVVTYSYEFYFDKPVSVADTFLIGVRYPYLNDIAQIYARWDETGCTSKNIQWDYHNIQEVSASEIDFCNHHIREPSGLWGCYFPILTPRDTTRCYPVREVSMFTATDTSITLTWRADNATQWEVEYAEADGMTAYTVTTTTPRVTLTGLRPTTTYLAHVRAWCARDSEYGEWSPFMELQTTAHQPDDTTQGPDTVSVDVVGLFTRLAPNPATGLVTVQSSYSLNHVAVYDVQGHLVLEQKAAGTAATFDVGRLPKGVYVVSIRTAAGTTTKRLLVTSKNS